MICCLWVVNSTPFCLCEYVRVFMDVYLFKFHMTAQPNATGMDLLYKAFECVCSSVGHQPHENTRFVVVDHVRGLLNRARKAVNPPCP